MKEVIPYQDPQSALKELDNGGRFYNLFTRADDGKVTPAELAKVAGVFNNRQSMILFLEMSLEKFSKQEKETIFQKLSPTLQEAYTKYLPSTLSPKEARTSGKVSDSAIVSGIPKLLDTNSTLGGFIMVPIMSGSVTTFMMIPIFERYEVYALRDAARDKEFIIAHTKGTKLPEQKVRCGGVLKELNEKKDESGNTDLFLEIQYYTVD